VVEALVQDQEPDQVQDLATGKLANCSTESS
jgi:hypothetical protein